MVCFVFEAEDGRIELGRAAGVRVYSVVQAIFYGNFGVRMVWFSSMDGWPFN